MSAISNNVRMQIDRAMDKAFNILMETWKYYATTVIFAAFAIGGVRLMVHDALTFYAGMILIVVLYSRALIQQLGSINAVTHEMLLDQIVELRAELEQIKRNV